MAGDGLRQFQETLQDLNGWVDSFTDLSERDRAEGHVYIAGMARWATERAFMSSDTDRPRFVRCMDTFSRWGLENPDNVYLSADIRGDAEYLIKGDRGRCVDLVFEVLTGLVGDDGGLGSGISSLDASTLKTGANGHFEIKVGGSAGGGNHLAARKDAGAVFVRWTSGDWANERPGWLTIEKIGPSLPLPVNETRSASLCWAQAARRLRDQVKFMDQWAGNWRKSLPFNSINAPSSRGDGFLPGQFNAFGQYDIEDGKALVVSAKSAECRYSSIVTGHRHWLCTFDYRNRQNSLNSTQARLSSDGRYHFVICASDPGVPNWIDTVHHQRGFVFLRWQAVTGAPPEPLSVSLLPVSQVRSLLPPDEPVVDQASRLNFITARRNLVDRHFA